MKEWAKWQLLDYRVPNRHLELRFDEIENLILQGEIGQSDLICAPGSHGYQSVSECSALHYQYTKAFYAMFHDHTIEPKYLEYHFGLPINRRTAFVQENYFFSEFYKRKKLSLIEKCAGPLLKILEPKEEINFIFSAEADLNLSRIFRFMLPRKPFLETLVVITNRRVIQAFWNPDQTRAQSFKSVYLDNINHFQFRMTSRRRLRLTLSIYREKLFAWANINQVDRVQVEAILQARIPVGSFPRVARSDAYLPNLCKSCYSKLTPDTLQCPLCDTQYVSPQKIYQIAHFAPGLGFLHAGFKTLGWIWLGGEIFLVLYLMAALVWFGPESWQKGLMFFSLLVLFAGLHRSSAGDLRSLISEMRPLVQDRMAKKSAVIS